MIFERLLSKKRKYFSLLIDPDKHTTESLANTVKQANHVCIDCFLIGGSLVAKSLDKTVDYIKSHSSIPVFLFPGNLMQLSNKADGILLITLISGRNPEYLIGNHVLAAPFLKKSGLEIIPTGYILIESSYTTSVEYISNTKPIPVSKPDIVVATAMAGEMLGLKCIYLEAGSGANSKIPASLIAEVKKNIHIPLIVGGGIRTKQDAAEIYNAGADMVIVGTAVEENIELLNSFAEVFLKY